MTTTGSALTESLELLDVGLGVFDAEFRLTYCNSAFRLLRQYPEAECTPGKSVADLLRFNAERGDFGEGETEAIIAGLMDEIKAGDTRERERTMADGQVLGITYRRTSDGSLIVSYQDRTAERQAQAALQRSEERYALISDAAEEALYEWDIENATFFSSPRLNALLGRLGDARGKRNWLWDDLVHPDDLMHYRDTLKRHLEGADEGWRCEYRLRTGSGDWFWVSDHGKSIRGEDGNALRMVAAVRDITDRIERDAALAASEERYALVSRATNDGIYDWDVTNDRLFVSDNLTRILEIDLANGSSSMWAERVHPDDYPGYLDAVRSHFKGETDAVEHDYRIQAKDGGFRWVHDRGVGVRSNQGRVIRLVGAVSDISNDIAQSEALRASEERYGAVTEAMSDWLFEFDFATGSTELSEKMPQYFGFGSRIIHVSDWLALVHPDDREAYDDAIRTAVKSQRDQSEVEYRMLNLDGNYTWLRQFSIIKRREDGRATRLIGTCRNIDDIKAIQEDAERAHTQLSAALATISDGLLVIDAEGRVELWNDRYAQIFGDAASGADMSDVIVKGRPFFEMIHHGYSLGMFKPFPGGADAWVEQRRKGWDTPRWQTELELANGKWILQREREMPDGARVSVYTDITEFKQREAEIQKARQLFEEAIEAITTGFALWDSNDRLIVGNSRYRGYFAELSDMVIPGNSFSDIVRAGIERGLFPMAEGDIEGYVAEILQKRRKGIGEMREQFVGNAWLQITDHKTKEGGIVSIYTDITDIKQKQAEIEKQAEILELTLENMVQGISLVDEDLKTMAFNNKFLEILDLPADRFERGFTMDQAFRYNAERGDYGPGDVEEQVRSRLELAAKFQAHRFERERSDGTVIEVVGNPIIGGGFVSTYTDITELKRHEAEIIEAKEAAEAALDELKRAQDRLVQSEKMASLGQLTAGIAHEIKNPLNFVNNFAKLSKELLIELAEVLEGPIGQLEDDDRYDAEDLLRTVKDNLTKIDEHGARADSIVKNMLLHSREGPSESRVSDLNVIAQEAINLAYHGARAEDPAFNVTLKNDLDPGVGKIACYPQELTRVFLNLAGNGMYAAHKRKEAEEGRFAPTLTLSSRDLGDHVAVEVRDNGTGIPADLIEKIFTPFFTTKPTGEGTGLGLSLSYDIVTKQHGGTLTVESTPGDHTTFTVRLPRQGAP